MKMRAGNVGFMFVTVLLVLASAYFCVGTVMSRTNLDNRELEAYYHEKERELVAEAREFLDGEGFTNSGVMLTRVIDGDGSRQYTLTVHHGRIDKMCQEDRELLQAQLEQIVFQDDACTFRHEFLINQ